MSEAKKRNAYSSEFKAKVGLEAIRGMKTINEIGQEYRAKGVRDEWHLLKRLESIISYMKQPTTEQPEAARRSCEYRNPGQCVVLDNGRSRFYGNPVV